MRILQVYFFYLPNIGGIETVMYNLGREMIKRGHEVVVFTSKALKFEAAGLKAYEEIDGIKVFRFTLIPMPNKYVFLTPGVMNAIDRVRPDIIHVFSYFPSFITNVVAFQAKIRRIPLVFTPIYNPRRINRYKTLFQRVIGSFFDYKFGIRILKMADAVTALTKEEANFYRERGIKNVEVVPVGVTVKNIPQSRIRQISGKYGLDSCQVVLSVGRIVEYKGVDLLVQAWKIVQEELLSAKLVIVGGDWGYMQQAKVLADKLGCRNIIFTGEVEEEKLSALYEISNVIVAPSKFETFGIIAIEAWSHKKPIITFDLAGVTEHITPDMGIKVSRFDIGKLANAMITLLRDEKIALRMGEEGYRKYLGSYTWEKIANKLEKKYSKIRFEINV